MKIFHIRSAQNHMATTFEFCISTQAARIASAERVLEEAHRLVAALEDELSEFRLHSAVSRINQSVPTSRVLVGPATIALLDYAEHLRELTDSAFDVGAKGKRSVSPAFGWDRASQTAWRNGSDEHLSFGAIGKGYALDRVRDILYGEQFEDFVLNAGGSSLIFAGSHSPGVPWSWGWSWKKDGDGNPLGIELAPIEHAAVAVGISGTHEKGEHIVRKDNAFIAPRSALVATESATHADALSTGLFGLGWDRGHSKLSESYACAVIDDEEVPRWNLRFARLFGPLVAALCLFLAPLIALADDTAAVNQSDPATQTEAAAEDAPENAIDLSDLGMEDFHPYEAERNTLWILLPIASLALVALHLKRPPRKDEQEFL